MGDNSNGLVKWSFLKLLDSSFVHPFNLIHFLEYLALDEYLLDCP